MMSEDLLQFIWQYSLYNPLQLKTQKGEALTIIHPGRRNKNAGPDFDEAKIKVGETIWVGNIELHLRSSDWQKHGHHLNKAFHNIILHVVLEDDCSDAPSDCPVLCLGPHIPDEVLKRYTGLLQTAQQIPCSSQLSTIKSITKESWLNRMLIERWEQKLAEWEAQLQRSAGNWNELFYVRLAANFGFHINTTPFLLLAQSIPLTLFAKHKESLMTIEALLLGQAGFLDEVFMDEYPRQLQEEYRFLKSKYQLTPIPKHLWKFLRLRPANFPTIRIAQFATLIYQSWHLFSQVLSHKNVKELTQLFSLQASHYWSHHYQLDDAPHDLAPKSLGRASIENIIINTIAPIRFLFANQQGNMQGQEDALQLLTTLRPEKNSILNQWQSCGWQAVNAAQSQAMLQLYHNYCTSKRCLECAIGLSIIKAVQPNP